MAGSKNWTPKDLYQEVTNKIISNLESAKRGERPWDLMTVQGRAKNGTTNVEYRGLNPWLLAISAKENGFTDNRWATFKQASERKIKLSKGSVGTKIYFSSPFEVEDKDPKTGETRRNDDGSPKMKSIPMLKEFTVFNAQQFENFPPDLTVKIPENDWTPVQAAEEIVKSMNVSIRHGGNEAYYRPSTDSIQMPERGQFKSAEDYYSVLLHELGHSTGHESRLARNLKGGFGSPDYAYEELIAEISAAYSSAELGLNSDANDERHSAYVKSWVQALKNDKKMIFKAAKDAEKVHSWVMNMDRTPANGPTPEPTAPAAENRTDLRNAKENVKDKPELLKREAFEKEPPKPVEREEKTSRYDRYDKKIERYAEIDRKNQRGIIRDGDGKEVWSGGKNSRKSLVSHMNGLSLDSLSPGVAENEMCTWMNSFFMDSYDAGLGPEDFPLPQKKALLKAEMPEGKLDAQDQIKVGAAMEKRGLLYENGYLTAEGISAVIALQEYVSKLEEGMPLSEHNPAPAPNKTATQQNAMWGDRLMKGQVGDENAWSNGHVLMVWDETTAKQMPSHLPLKANMVDMDRVWPAETGREVTPLAVSGKLGTVYQEDGKGEFKDFKQVWFDSEQAVDAKYYDLVNRTFGEENVTWRQNASGDHAKPLEVYVGEKRVGLVMGNRAASNDVPAGVRAVLDEHKKMQDTKPQPMWHVERGNDGMTLVSPGGEKKDIPDFNTLQRTVSTIVAYDNGVSEIRDALEEQYWKKLPTKDYVKEADKLMQERYGVTLADAEPPKYASSSQAMGMHPGIMVHNLGDKYALQPLSDVTQPYSAAPRQNTPGAPTTQATPGVPSSPSSGPTQTQGRAVHSSPVAPSLMQPSSPTTPSFGGSAPV